MCCADTIVSELPLIGLYNRWVFSEYIPYYYDGRTTIEKIIHYKNALHVDLKEAGVTSDFVFLVLTSREPMKIQLLVSH